MLNPFIVVALGLSLLAAVLAYCGVGPLRASLWGRVALAVGAGGLPLLSTAGGLATGFKASSSTEFCLSCHEMTDYGASLFVDNRASLAAIHYQSRLIERSSTCYECHQNYAMFGDFKTKFDGLKHVWVHYLGEAPSPLELYQPYPNSNCLHCHADARSYLESRGHAKVLKELASNERSCLDCHRVAHDFEALEAHRFWEAEPK